MSLADTQSGMAVQQPCVQQFHSTGKADANTFS